VVRARNGPATVEVRYADGGIPILGVRNTLTLTFGNNGLTRVMLTSKECLSAVVRKLPQYRSALSDRYGPGRTQREVTPAGEFVATRTTFSNRVTRVMLRAFSENPLAQYQPSVSGSGALGGLADIFSAAGANAALRRCPSDNGQLGVVEIAYESERVVRAAEAEERSAAERLRRDARDRF